jgi:hypothetical protein
MRSTFSAKHSAYKTAKQFASFSKSLTAIRSPPSTLLLFVDHRSQRNQRSQTCRGWFVVRPKLGRKLLECAALTSRPLSLLNSSAHCDSAKSAGIYPGCYWTRAVSARKAGD